MAYSVGNQVRVVDQSTDYRNRVGVVQAVSGDSHEVRLDGYGCNTVTTFLTGQLQADSITQPTDYSQCES